MSALRKIADVLAVVFHPVFLFFYVVLLVTDPLLNNYRIWIITILTGTVIIPIIITSLTGDIYLTRKTGRQIPLILVCAVYILTFFILEKFQYGYPLSNKIDTGVERIQETFGPVDVTVTTYSQLILQNLLAITLGLIVLSMGNFWRKFSLHAGGYGFVLVFLIQPFNELVSCLNYSTDPQVIDIISGLIFCVVIPWVIWQRVKSGAHTVSEVATGLAIGILTSALVKFTPVFYWLV